MGWLIHSVNSKLNQLLIFQQFSVFRSTLNSFNGSVYQCLECIDPEISLHNFSCANLFIECVMLLLLLYLLVSERRGHRKFRLTSRKNYERKKAARKATQASIVQDGNSDEKHCADAVSTLSLSLPLSLYTDSEVSDLSLLSRRLFRMESINEGLFIMFLCSFFICTLEWISVFEDETLSFCQLCLSDSGLEVTYSLMITEDFSWSVTYRRAAIHLSLCTYLQESPLLVNSGTKSLLIQFMNVTTAVRIFSFKGCGVTESC